MNEQTQEVQLAICKKNTDNKMVSFKQQIKAETNLTGKELDKEWRKRCATHSVAAVAFIESKRQEGFVFDAPRPYTNGDFGIRLIAPKVVTDAKGKPGYSIEDMLELQKKYPNLSAAELIKYLQMPVSERPQA